jgi:hypothetical protein
MTGCEAYEYLLNNLRHLGAIKWHSNTTSFYIKFRDIRIGSVRLSNHNSRERYNYTYEYKSDKDYFEIEVLDEMIDGTEDEVVLREISKYQVLLNHLHLKTNIYNLLWVLIARFLQAYYPKKSQKT